MKIEKISDTQIRCTLDRSDLHSRDLKLSELAYGTEKAKNLFHDMIEQASFEFDFDADDSPLMIEAVPVSPDCIILTITKVVHPEELDDKFPVFGGDDSEDDDEFDDMSEMISEIRDKVSSDDFIPISKTLSGMEPEPDECFAPEEPEISIFSFNTWNDAAVAAAQCYNFIKNSLDFASRFYKDEAKGKYCLLLESGRESYTAYQAAVELLSEYAPKLHTTYATVSYIKEHCNMLIKNDAIRILTKY